MSSTWNRQPRRQRRMFVKHPTIERLEDRVVLSTFKVNTPLDTVATNLKTGKDSSGHISLRSAIEAANAKPNGDTIILPPATIGFTIAGSGENQSASGDLDIQGNLTIKGKGSGKTIIDANNLDRVFDILGGKVVISGVTIQHGNVLGGGGGLLNEGGNVTLSSVRLQNNVVFGDNGSIGVNGMGGGARGNSGGGGGGGGAALGGAIENRIGSLTIKNGVISTNQANAGDGGHGGNGAIGTGAAGSTDSDGEPGTGGAGGTGGSGGSAFGGGVYNETGASLTLISSVITGNAAQGGDGGAGGFGAVGSGGAGVPGSGAATLGGEGNGGAGGAGGGGGNGKGGGLFNAGRVTLSGKASEFTSNQAIAGAGGAGEAGANGVGGPGGNGSLSQAGADGGVANGGVGGKGGRGGNAFGGGVFNGTAASMTGTGLQVLSSFVGGGSGGDGGGGGFAIGGQGGSSGTGHGGGGGEGSGGEGGAGGSGGAGEGGGLFNDQGGAVVFKAQRSVRSQQPSVLSSDGALGGRGGDGGFAGGAFGGLGGTSAAVSAGGIGGVAVGANGGSAGAGGSGFGGGVYTQGLISMAGVTANFTKNEVRAGNGGDGGKAREANGGAGGVGKTGGKGGDATGGDGGDGGESGTSIGGGIMVDHSGALILNPRIGAKRGSKQAKGVDLITGNLARAAGGGEGGEAGTTVAGAGGVQNGKAGTATPGGDGSFRTLSLAIGGGVGVAGMATLVNANITGNQADSSDNDVANNIKT